MSTGLFHQYFWSGVLAEGDLTPRRRENPLTILPWSVTSQLLFPRRPGGDHLRLDPEHERRVVIEQFIEEALAVHEAEIGGREAQKTALKTNLQYGRLVRELNVLRKRRTVKPYERIPPTNPNEAKVFKRVQRAREEKEQMVADALKQMNRVKMARVRAEKELKK